MSEPPFFSEPGLVTKEDLPPTSLLSLTDFQHITSVGCGLRITSPSARLAEIAEGVMGDYIIVSDPSPFVRAKDSFQAAMDPDQGLGNIVPELLTRQLVCEGKFEDLESPEKLPERFNKALYRFLLRAAIPSLRWQIRDSQMTVEQLIGVYPLHAAPAVLLIKHNPAIRGHDQRAYFGFGKCGRRFIASHRIIDSMGIGADDVELLSRRYKDILFQPAIALFEKANKRTYEYLDEDVAVLLLNHSLDMIRRFIISQRMKS